MLHPETASYSDFPAQFDRIASNAPTFVRRGGKTKAVVLSPRDFQAYLAARERIDILEAVEQGRREFAAGGGMSIEDFERRVRASLKTRKRRSRRP